jgi:predicted small lipoprotein YifL
MILLIPLISYGIADLIVKANFANNWMIVPAELAGPAQYPYLYLRLIVAAVVAVAIFGLFTVVYTLIYSIAGPPRYGPLDAPPAKKRSSGRSR